MLRSPTALSAMLCAVVPLGHRPPVSRQYLVVLRARDFVLFSEVADASLVLRLQVASVRLSSDQRSDNELLVAGETLRELPTPRSHKGIRHDVTLARCVLGHLRCPRVMSICQTELPHRSRSWLSFLEPGRGRGEGRG